MKKNTIRFFHVADIHFGVENYGRIDPHTGIHSRLLDFKKSFDACVDAAIKENIDFLVFAGDAYKTAHPTPTQQKLLSECFFRLWEAGIPVIIVVGNHDHPLSFGKAHALDLFAHLPVDGFFVFSKPGIQILTTKKGPVQVVGIPWPTRHTLVNKGEHFHKGAEELAAYLSLRIGELVEMYVSQLDPNLPAVLAAHCTMAQGVFSGSERRAIFGADPVLFPSQLALFPLDYVALGHLHRHQQIGSGNPPVVYSGSIDRIDFGERKETKGYCDVFIHFLEDGTRKTEFAFVPLSTRPFIQIELSLAGEEGHTEQIIQAIKSHDVEGAIVKVLYTVPSHIIQDRVHVPTVLQTFPQVMSIPYIVSVKERVLQERRGGRMISYQDQNISSLLKNYFSLKNIPSYRQERLLKRAEKLMTEESET